MLIIKIKRAGFIGLELGLSIRKLSESLIAKVIPAGPPAARHFIKMIEGLNKNSIEKYVDEIIDNQILEGYINSDWLADKLKEFRSEIIQECIEEIKELKDL